MKRVFVALLFVAIAYAVYRRHEDTKPLPFSVESWAVADENTRGRMADDLIAKRLLIGMTNEEVEQLLGPRDISDRYGIGCRHSTYVTYFMEWSYFLYFQFDEAGRVKSVSIAD